MGFFEGAIVQKVERPVRDAVLLSVRSPGRTAFLLVLGGATPAIGEIERPSSRLPADAPLMRLRAALEGARIVSLSRRVDGFRLQLRRGDERPALLATRSGVTPIEGESATEEHALFEDEHAASELATRAFAEHVARLREARLRAIGSSIDAARRKLRKRLVAIDGDLARIGGADLLQRDAALLSANAHAIARGQASVTLTDWASGEPIAIALDPAKSARENAEALFHRAKRLKKGRAIAEARRAETERALAALDRLHAEAEAAADDAALGAVEEKARALGVGPPRAKTGERAKEPQARKPYTEFRVRDRTILVGRGAEDNDALTTKVARPHDLWLHAKGRTGAHVVVPMRKGESPSPELLVDAAHLAAHFSDARGERVVEVQWAERRHVRKPKGSPKGAVVVDREKVIVLRVEPERLERLLSSRPS